MDVRHWTDAYFSFTTTRDDGFRFENGQFVMIGLEVPQADGTRKPLLRAYSIASANWEEQLEFFSIKVANGPLTSRLQHIQPGDTVLIGRKPTGTLLIHDLHPGRNLYLLGTGTGFAPWLATIKDPETYERFDKVILCHGVRNAHDLAYRNYIVNELPRHEFLGEQIAAKLLYYPAVSREELRVRRPRPARAPHRTAGQRAHGRAPRPAGARPGTRPRHALRQPADARRLPRHPRPPRLQRRAAHRRAGAVRVRARIRREVIPNRSKVARGTGRGCLVFTLPGQTMAQQLRRADLAVYEAKAAGRDRMVMRAATRGRLP